ncbi:MAG: DMT family transporter [Vicingaceae bacterium]
MLIFGFTGILGKLIELPAGLIVLYRMVIASVSLAIILRLRNIAFLPQNRQHLKWLITGVVVGMHWFFFFESIKVSTVSVALVSLSSSALFTSILEPIFHRRKLKAYELVFGLMIIVGMILVLQFEYRYWLGITFGIISAFLASLFTVMNSRYVINNVPSLISFYELAGGAIFILAMNLISDPEVIWTVLPNFMDMFYLLLLAIVATAIAFVVSVQVMRKLSAFTVSLSINLEPLYGMILALLIFGEEEVMSSGFYLGFTIILGTILLNAYLKKKSSRLTPA